MDKGSRIYVAGHNGMVGSALVRNLKSKGYRNIIGKTRSQLDLMDQKRVEEFFAAEMPQYVFLAAAKVGGIYANNTYPADFMIENQLIQCNVIKSSFQNSVHKLMFLGSSCIYPRLSPQPIKEEYLLTGSLEGTNEAYALAKISGLKICQYFNRQYGTKYLSVMPCNLYGPNDNYHLENSHVIPALIRKMHEAKRTESPYIEVWGSGKPLREFLHVDDLADACVLLMENYEGGDYLNVGTGEEISIRELAEIIKKVTGFQGDLRFNAKKPDGVQRKVLDVSKLEGMGWKYRIKLEDGLSKTYEDYLKNLRTVPVGEKNENCTYRGI